MKISLIIITIIFISKNKLIHLIKDKLLLIIYIIIIKIIIYLIKITLPKIHLSLIKTLKKPPIIISIKNLKINQIHIL
jgi:hypothetical protein